MIFYLFFPQPGSDSFNRCHKGDPGYLNVQDYIDTNTMDAPKVLWQTIEEMRLDSTHFASSLIPKKPYYSSYLAICQRSGSGKTRLMLELGKRFCPLFYVCLGGPLPSPRDIVVHLKEKLKGTSLEDSVKKAQKFFAACGQFLCDELEKEGLPKPHTAEYLKVCRSLVATFQPSDKTGNEKMKATWIKIIEMSEKSNLSYATVMNKLKSEGIPHFILAIDEARGLIAEDETIGSAFRFLRGALKYIVDSEPVHPVPVMLLADTNSRVANFAPIVEQDPSLRDLAEGGDLFRHLCSFPTSTYSQRSIGKWHWHIFMGGRLTGLPLCHGAIGHRDCLRGLEVRYGECFFEPRKGFSTYRPTLEPSSSRHQMN